MANITLKDVPDDLHERLRAAAVETGRSLNKMILALLETAVGPHKSDRLVLLDRIRARRSKLHRFLDDTSLEEAIDEGRACR
jgi:plasmid stability protein